MHQLLELDQKNNEPTALSSSCYIDRSSRLYPEDQKSVKTKSFRDYVELLDLIGEGRYGKIY
ncbi:hypothetical protein HZS_4763 [Henneguya salminicola]|nr:hypothetical protein HZS_4763 [Henneguya salminicola]